MNPIKWDDSWLGQDKTDHFRVGAVAALALTVLLALLPVPTVFAAWGAVIVGCSAALAKEIFDLFAEDRTPSPQDAIATIAGTLVGGLAGAGVVSGLRYLQH